MPKAQPFRYVDDARFYSPMQRVLEPLLVPGEQVDYVASISPALYWKAIVAFLLSIPTLLYAFNLGIYLLVISLLLAVMAYFTRQYLLLAATNQRVICRFGVLYVESLSLRYERIESVEISTSLMGQVLGYSNIILRGTGRLRLMVPYVVDALEFRDEVLVRMSEQQSKN